MAARARGTGARADRVVLLVVALLAAALIALLVLRLHSVEASARAESYPQATQPPPVVAVPSVAFIGDSYSAGTGSSGFDSRFTTLLAAYEGWDSTNYAFGGTGYQRSATTNARVGCGQELCPDYAAVIDRVAAANPNIVVVSGGRNDVGLPEAELQQSVDRFFTTLRAALPKARIVVTSPVWAYSSPPAQLQQIASAVRQAAQGVDAEYLDIGEPLVGDRSLVSRDKVHPNDAGHAELARVIEVALSDAAATPSPAGSTGT